MVHQRDAKQPVVLGGKAKRLLRIFHGRYAMCVADVARALRISERQAWRYITRLYNEKLIYPRYRQHRYIYYSVRRKL